MGLCDLERGAGKARAGDGRLDWTVGCACLSRTSQICFKLLLTLSWDKSTFTQKYKFETMNSTSVSDNIVSFPP